jgi:hypothetical protein
MTRLAGGEATCTWTAGPGADARRASSLYGRCSRKPKAARSKGRYAYPFVLGIGIERGTSKIMTVACASVRECRLTSILIPCVRSRAQWSSHGL